MLVHCSCHFEFCESSLTKLKTTNDSNERQTNLSKLLSFQIKCTRKSYLNWIYDWRSKFKYKIDCYKKLIFVIIILIKKQLFKKQSNFLKAKVNQKNYYYLVEEVIWQMVCSRCWQNATCKKVKNLKSYIGQIILQKT